MRSGPLYELTSARAIALSAIVVTTVLAWPLFVKGRLVDGFHAHGYCYLWDPTLVSLHVISDALIGLSYVAISVTLAYLVFRGREHIPFSWMFLAFGAFIIACGGTHFVEIFTLWVPAFWFAANVKVITALASVTTAVALPPLVPRILRLVESAHLSEDRKTQLDVATRELATLDALRRSEDERARLLALEHDAREQAEAANRTKDEFLASVSHELRTPLNAMLGWSRMLREGVLKPDETTRAIEIIERNANVQAQLIEDLLDVSRIITGKLRLDVRPVELRPVIESAIEAVSPAADARDIRLQSMLDPLPIAISGDPDRLQQIVWNLLSNAIKFTPKGGRVQVRLERVNSHVQIVVSDTGEGIDPELLPHVFERFTQGSGPSLRRQGLGLGLGIVRHLTELHGGTAEAASGGRGLGSTFAIKLPVMPVRTPAPSERHPSKGGVPLPFEPSAALRGATILVVDDDDDGRELVVRVLEQEGAVVQAVASAREAVAALDGGASPQVIVSDIEMPEEDGYALIRAIRARSRSQGGGIPAIALTAYARAQDRMDALRAGFDMHIPKPVESAELVTVVATLIKRAASR